VQTIADEARGTEAQSAVTTHLSPDTVGLLAEALEATQATANEGPGAHALSTAPATRGCRAHQLSEFSELSAALRAFSAAERQNLLGDAIER
jgi:hypothetical protein